MMMARYARQLAIRRGYSSTVRMRVVLMLVRVVVHVMVGMLMRSIGHVTLRLGGASLLRRHRQRVEHPRGMEHSTRHLASTVPPRSTR